MTLKILGGLLVIWMLSSGLCAEPVPAPAPNQVKVKIWFDNLTLKPNDSQSWFEDDVSKNEVRWFTTVPLTYNTGIDEPFVPFDQILEITNVFYILKGEAHNTDGSGGARTLQVNVTVRNRTEHEVHFRIYKAEVYVPGS